MLLNDTEHNWSKLSFRENFGAVVVVVVVVVGGGGGGGGAVIVVLWLTSMLVRW